MAGMGNRFKSIRAAAALTVLAASAASAGAVAAPQTPSRNAGVLVFAAASLQTALDELVGPAERATGLRMRVSYAASSALARQIENGAPADLFISADLDWMNYLDGRHLIRSATRGNLLGNALVLVAAKSHPVPLRIANGFPIARALGDGRLAMADPAAVPAGKYARAALTSLGVWDAVAGRVAGAENVRAALQLVARGEAPLGIVYRTDAVAEPNVVVVDTFPPSSHPEIVYPIALTTAASPGASKLLDFLRTAPARAAFEKQGFTVLTRE
jgi:molybdate transport system substrate-binding protein